MVVSNVGDRGDRGIGEGDLGDRDLVPHQVPWGTGGDRFPPIPLAACNTYLIIIIELGGYIIIKKSEINKIFL